MLILLIAFGAIQARSQETRPTDSAADSVQTQPAPNGEKATNAADVCEQRLLKTLDALAKSEASNADLSAELVTNKSLREKEEIYNAELLKGLSLLLSSEKRNKSFFKQVEEQLGRILKTVTDPKSLTTIVSLIVLTKQLRK